MFTPSELENISIKLEQQFKDLEYRIMNDIVERIKTNSEITRTTDWKIYRLQQLGKSKEDIKEHIKSTLNLSDKEVNRIYNDVIEKGYTQDARLYKSKGLPIIPFNDNLQLKQFISAIELQTNSDLYNITQSMGFAVKENGSTKFKPIANYYQETLDNAMLDISSGSFSYGEVLNRTVSEMTNSGLRSVDYASGWSNRVDVATRRAVMTGFGQITSKITDENAEQLQTNLYEVDWHMGARPTHQEWQGRVYTKEQLKSICGLGTGPGLNGWNCYHSYYPFVEGASERVYTDKELAEMNAKENTQVQYKGKEYTVYEATQRQRALETTMRAQREKIMLLKNGGGSKDDLINARFKYRALSADYTQFSKAMKLPLQRERITIDGLGNIGQGKWKIDLISNDYNDILYMRGKMSDIAVRKWYLHHNKMIPDLIDIRLPIEAQARQAFDLRNQFRTEARELMSNQEARKQLDITDPNKSFEELVKDKINRKKITHDEAVADVLHTSGKTRKTINKKFGVEE